MNKIEIEAARGNNPSMLLGQSYTENVVYRHLLDNLTVLPSSHTVAGGRPALDDGELSPEGEQARADETNLPENREG